MSTVLQVKSVSKTFTKFDHEIYRVLSWFGLKVKALDHSVVIDDIDFSIESGEAVAIVGKNGAGKSTLLKLVAGIIKPSSGQILTHGRISAILELGMGFHPDLTGRQNIYKTGGLMGFSRTELDTVVEEIKQFSEIGKYFEEPVRTYSSGMQVRVAFGLATAFRPDILIVDEALSVGDSYFQKKSFKRIREFQKQGTTLILVSHDKDAVQDICDKAILLEKGKIKKISNPQTVFDYYHATIGANQENEIIQEENTCGRGMTKSGTGSASVAKALIVNSNGDKVNTIKVGEDVKFIFEVDINDNIDQLTFGYSIQDRLGRVLYGINSMLMNKVAYNLNKNDKVRFIFDFTNHLGVGEYTIQTSLDRSGDHTEKNYEWIDNAIIFDVTNSNQYTFVGNVWLNSMLEIEYMSNKDES